MKLSDLYGDDAKYVKHIDEYVHHGNRSKYLTAAYNHLMKNPKYVYTGEMYRLLCVSKKLITQTTDVRLMTAKLHQYAQKHEHKTVFAWSKIVGDGSSGALSAVISQTKFNSNMTSFGIILGQNASALDINALFENDDYHTDWYIKEQELLAQMTNDVNLQGFWWRNNTYNIDEFEEFVDDVRNGEL